MALRLMGQYNVTQAEVLAHELPSTQRQYAGRSDVQLLRVDADKSKSVRHQNYVRTLCWAMSTFFDCKSYSVGRRSSLVLTFYGIAENTIAAALAFEMVYNLICEWARPYKRIGRKNSYSLGVCDEMNRMTKQKKKDELAEAKKAEEEATATKVRQEESERQAQLDRLRPFPLNPSGSSSPEPVAHISGTGNVGSSHTPSQGNGSGLLLLGYDKLEYTDLGNNEDPEADMDDDFSDDCTEPDFEVQDEEGSDTSWDQEDETGNITKGGMLSFNATSGFSPTLPAANTAKTSYSNPLGLNSATPLNSVSETTSASTNLELEPENKWASQMQLQLFRETASKIADDYLRECNIKLRAATKRRINVIRDRCAYNQGVEDSKKIDIHRKRITESANSNV